jgi:predicted phage terminase large subunit-like protein
MTNSAPSLPSNLTANDVLLARKALAERHFSEFVKQAWHVLEPNTPLKWGWVMDAICDHLEAVTRGDIKRLVINVPPGTSKSLLTSVLWPCWEWIKKPSLRYLSTAHKQDIAIRDNLKARRLITSAWYQSNWPLELAGDQNAKTKFENVHTGFRECSAFTSMTGIRASRVLVDDPHSVDDALSPVKLLSAVTTFREALPSRVENEDSAIVIIMQRLNESDISKVALSLGYDHLCIPMRFEADRRCTTSIGWSDPRTYDGELMFPDRFPDDQVRALELSLGSYASAGQLQQRPAPREGGMFKKHWFEMVPAVPADVTRIRKWDLAATTEAPGKDPDYTVGTLMARDQNGLFYIEDVIRFRGSAHEVEQTIRNTASLDGTNVHILLPQDPGQAGKAQAGALTRMLAGFNVAAEPETGNKETRATPFAAQCEAGNVKVVKANWNDAWFDELGVFPYGAHDDQVDSASGAFAKLVEMNSPVRVSQDVIHRLRLMGRR